MVYRKEESRRCSEDAEGGGKWEIGRMWKVEGRKEEESGRRKGRKEEESVR